MDFPAPFGPITPTIPPGGIDAGRNGLFVRANADVVYVAFRDTVAAVAARWGFANAGRFAVEYRRIYGCSPGEVLRR